MARILITNCTSRKRVKANAKLNAATLGPGTLLQVAQEWRTRVSECVDQQAAKWLYCGRSFSESVSASVRLDAQLWIVSAGMGLISADDLIPAYDLSVSNASCSPGSHMDDSWDCGLWWIEVNKIWSPKRSISRLVAENPTSLAIVALSGPYLEMVGDDLQKISPTELNRVRLIVHPANRQTLPTFDRYIMPYDERLDGQGSCFRGTRSDFVARSAHHFCSLLGSDCRRDVDDHRNLVEQSLGLLQHPQRISRNRRTDEEIVQLIIRNWDESNGQSVRMLRILRDKEVVACEQSRFRRLFHAVANEIAIQCQ